MLVGYRNPNTHVEKNDTKNYKVWFYLLRGYCKVGPLGSLVGL